VVSYVCLIEWQVENLYIYRIPGRLNGRFGMIVVDGLLRFFRFLFVCCVVFERCVLSVVVGDGAGGSSRRRDEFGCGSEGKG